MFVGLRNDHTSTSNLVLATASFILVCSSCLRAVTAPDKEALCSSSLSTKLQGEGLRVYVVQAEGLTCVVVSLKCINIYRSFSFDICSLWNCSDDAMLVINAAASCPVREVCVEDITLCACRQNLHCLPVPDSNFLCGSPDDTDLHDSVLSVTGEY